MCILGVHRCTNYVGVGMIAGELRYLAHTIGCEGIYGDLLHANDKSVQICWVARNGGDPAGVRFELSVYDEVKLGYQVTHLYRDRQVVVIRHQAPNYLAPDWSILGPVVGDVYIEPLDDGELRLRILDKGDHLIMEFLMHQVGLSATPPEEGTPIH